MTHVQTKGIALSAALVLIALACGGDFTKRANQTLSTALVATNAARDTFTAWDERHQLRLVEDAATREEAEAALKTYRDKRQAVVKAFAAAYAAIATAAATIPLVDKGERSETDLLVLIKDAVTAAATLKKSVELITGD
jgi:sialic acid synthase SpsE